MPPRLQFTWDRNIDLCQKNIDHLTQHIGQDAKSSHHAQEAYRRSFEALILAIAELREHPQLERNVPMLSLATLRWFPLELYEVRVNYEVPKLQYEVSVYQHDTTNQSSLGSLIEHKNVHLSKLPDTVAAFIEKTIQLQKEVQSKD